jgi:hypothetical protein
MYKLVITLNNNVLEPISFETWQRAYQSLDNHLWRYQWHLDSEILFQVFNPKGIIIKSIGMLTDNDGTQNLKWDNIENEQIRNLMRIYNNNHPAPAPTDGAAIDYNDFPF